MKLRISGLLASAAFALAGIVGGAQSLAQNAYITNQTNQTQSGPDDTVSVIDTETNTVIATIHLNNEVSPFGVAVTPEGSHVYVTNNGSDSVSVIDTETNTVTATIHLPVKSFPLGIAVTPNGSKVYVANEGLGTPSTVSVIATASNKVIATIPMGLDPFGVVVTPNGQHVYVVNNGSNAVYVIDTATNTVIDTIPVGNQPVGIAVTPDGRNLYVTGDVSNSVSVVDTATNKVTLIPYPVGTYPVGVAVTSDGSKVYVANQTANTVSVINTATNTVTATIPVGEVPTAFGMFIQPAPPAPKFAGTPGKANCYGQSVSALARQYGGLNNAAAALGFSSVSALQNAIMAFCEA